MPTAIIERPLSLFENFFRLRTEHVFYKTFQLCGTYSNPISKSALTAALRTVILKYHILACNVFPQGEDFIMRPISSISIDDLLVEVLNPDYLTDGTINELAMKFLNEYQFELYVEKPLFKVVFFNDTTMSLVFDHTLYDGVVGPYLHQDLVDCFNLLDESIANGTASVDPVVFDLARDGGLLIRSLPPPIDDYIPWDVDYAGGDPNYFDKVLPTLYERFHGRFKNSRDYTLAFKLINFSPDQLKTILAACKAHGVTLTAYLEVINALTFQPVFHNKYILSKVAIALRRHFNRANAPEAYKHYFDYQDHKNYGNLPHFGIAQVFEPFTTFSWDLVSTVSANLAKAVSNRNLLSMMTGFKNAYKPLESNEQLFTNALGGTKPENVKISNVGYIKFPEAKYTVEDMIFSQDVSSITSDLMVSVVSTAKGGLNIVISYIDSSFDDYEEDNFDTLIEKFKTNALECAAL